MLSKLVQTLKKEKKLQDIPQAPQTLTPTEIQWNQSPLSLNDYVIAEQRISRIFYIEDFINQKEHQFIWDQIYESQGWVTLPHALRRVQRYGGVVTQYGLQEQEPLPQYLYEIGRNLNERGVCDLSLNHVLINEYIGNAGIMDHFDGPQYKGFVNVLNLGGSVTINFTHPQTKQQIRLLLECCSLLVFSGEAYSQWQHGIGYYDEDSIGVWYEDGCISRTSVENGLKSQLIVQAQGIMNKYQQEEEVQFQYGNQLATITKVEQDHNYNRVINIKRGCRVSVTIRQV